MLGRFESILQAALIVSLVFGASPLKRVEGMSYIFSWKLYLSSIAIGILASAGGIFYIQKYFWSSLSMATIMDILIFTCSICTWIIVFLLFFVQRLELPAIISELYATHNRIGRVSYGRKYLLSMVCMTVVNAVPQIYQLVAGKFSWWKILESTLFYLFYNIPAVVAGQYSVLLNLLSDQLASISNLLSSSKFNLEVQHLVEIHFSLCSLAARINQAYDIFLLQTVTLPFVAVIMRTYVNIIYIVKPGEYSFQKMIASVPGLIVNCIMIVMVVSAARRAKNCAKNFNLLLFDALMTSKSLGKDNNLRSYVAMDYNINQSACGMFSLDYPLLTSMMASTATYVILLVQLTWLQ
ncbi:uncharacterized protein [Halyomorpha halys]|uniref:uncharacterized protein isoform X1 n=1 Tax=Halyomorpha halys TaxID=286706 RepID=UPI0034D2674E|nr:Gustatory receptor 161 [Halyomorpha halys]